MSELPINLLDAAIILVVLTSALLALLRGFTREVLAIVAWVGAAFATVKLFPLLRTTANAHISPTWAADLTLGAGLFIVGLVVLSLVSHQLAERVRSSHVGALDRSLGFLFGTVRGLLLVMVAYAAADRLLPEDERPAWMEEARLDQPLRAGGTYLLSSVLGAIRPAVDAPSDDPAERQVISQPASAPDHAPDVNTETGYQTTERHALDRLLEDLQDN